MFYWAASERVLKYLLKLSHYLIQITIIHILTLEFLTK